MKPSICVLLALAVFAFLFPPRAFAADDVEQLLLGDHVLTLQWLTNQDGVGKARIVKDAGRIVIDGYQEEHYEGERNYMTIGGTLRIVSRTELEFEGTIKTRIGYINAGLLHERSGKYRMKAWGKRKYWRMQNMTQPDGEYEVTDYIDLHFEKFKPR